MKKLLLLGLCLGALAGPARSQGAPADIVVVRIAESALGKTNVVITRGENRSEQMEFDSGFSDRKFLAGSERYYKLLASLYREGYKLTTTFSTAGGSVATLLFIKER